MRIFNVSIMRDVLSLLPKETPKNLILLVILQIAISLFDILALLVLGITSKLGLDYVQNKTVNFPDPITRILGVENVNIEKQFVIFCFLIVALFSCRTAASIYLSKRTLTYLGNQASYASKRIVEKMFRSKPQRLIAKNSQEFLYGVTSGIDNLTLNFLGSITILITELFFLIVLLCTLVLLQPLTGIIAILVFLLAIAGINKITSEKAKSLSLDSTNLNIFYNRRLLDTLLIYRDLFLRQKEISVSNEIQMARSKSIILRARLMFLPTLSKYLFELSLIVGSAIVGLIQILISDALTAISSVTIFLAAAGRILPSLVRAQGAYISVRQSEGGSAITLAQLRELEENVNHNEHLSEVINEKLKFIPSIKIVDLSFSYHTNSEFAIKDINIEICPGQFVAIVGESGSGKTTLIDLMLGMLSPKSGIVEISNLPNLEAIHLWPGKIAYVPQDIAIIDGSIRRNITLQDSEELPDDEIFKALDKSQLKDDVLAMENGLNELVGERGTRLSGGQRQRLGIARAMYTNPEIIIFDEATSALDPLTEKSVTNSIYGQKGKVTLVVVAHRLSTVKSADIVILMDKGKVIAQGTFEEVRSISPKFDEQAKLVNL